MRALKTAKSLHSTLRVRTVSFNTFIMLKRYQGQGPIEISSRIICESEPVEYNYIDVFTNKLLFTADGEATITRFNRSRMYSAGDQEFAQGVLKTTAAPNIEVTTSVENGCNTMAGVLPFQMIDVDGDHGLYYGIYVELWKNHQWYAGRPK